MSKQLEAAIVKLLDELHELDVQAEILRATKQFEIKAAIPPEIAAKLVQVDIKFDDKISQAAENIEKLREHIKTATLKQKSTVKGVGFMAVWSKGKESWDTKALIGYAAARPELLQFRNPPEPVVSIRKVKG